MRDLFELCTGPCGGVPQGRLCGWNNEAAAAIWSDCVNPVRPGSYPLFFWLLQLLHPRASVLDYGGSVGLTYYGYHRYARLPEGASWTIVELPLIADQGRRIAQREGTRNLFFTSDIGAPESCDRHTGRGGIAPIYGPLSTRAAGTAPETAALFIAE